MEEQEVDGGGRGSGTGGGAEETGKIEQSMCSGKKMRGEGSGDLFAKLKNYRDSSIN
jgi:hypothetical protein